ncbi:MAG TPA: hypothetical protein VD931_05765 [Baekduia sp.]|nr:hypothetical protein [Baekduia sp.]
MSRTTVSPTDVAQALVIRPATPADAPAVVRLAGLDSAERLSGDVLLAERDGRLVAARSLSDGRTIADPFVPTADVVEVLALRAASLGAPARRSSSARLWHLPRRRAVAA